MRRSPIVVTVQGARGPERVELVPDGMFFLVRQNEALACCVELDRGTETVRSNTGARDFAGKVRAYLAFAQARQLLVLTVVSAGERRLQNLQQNAARLGDRGTFYFASYSDASNSDLVLNGRIWRRCDSDSPVSLLP